MARGRDGKAPTEAAATADSERAKNHNLLLRVVTALTLLPVVLFPTWMGGEVFALLVSVAGAIAVLEYYEMSLGPDPLRIPGVLAVMAVPFVYASGFLGGPAHLHLVWAALAAVALTWRLLRDAPTTGAGAQVAHVVFGAIYCSLLGYLMPLRALGDESSWVGAGWAIMAFVLTWFGDTGAYFAGRFFGRTKLYPRISPAKTWEGLLGGVAACVGGAFLVRALTLPSLSALDCVALGVIGALAGVIGDLVESMLKRAFERKDSGSLLPGHGGMLDRIDALIAVTPAVYAYVHLVVLPRAAEAVVAVP